MLQISGNNDLNTPANENKMNDNASNHASSVGGDILNLLTITNLIKFKKPNLNQSKKPN